MCYRKSFFFFIFPLIITCIGCKYDPVAPIHSNGNGIDSGIRTGATLLWKTPKIRPTGTPVMPRQGGASCYMQPIRNGSKLYFIYDSIAQCLDPSTGKSLWITSFGGHLSRYYDADYMFFENGRLIFINPGKIISLNTETGQVLWSLNSPDDISGFHDSFYGISAQSPDAIFVTSWNTGELFKIDKTSGSIIWRNLGALLTDSLYRTLVPASSDWNGCPAYMNGRVYVPGRYGGSVLGKKGVHFDGSVACFDAASGSLLWCKLIPPMDPKYSPYVTNSVATTEFASNIGQGNISVFNNMLMVKTGNSVTWMDGDGNITWRSGGHDQHGLDESMYVSRFWLNKLLVFSGEQGMWQINAIDPTTHNYLWTTTLSENSTHYHSYGLCPPPAYVGNIVYFVSDDYWVIGVDVTSGLVKYALNLGNAVYDPTNANQVIEGNFLVDEDHHIYIMDNQYIYCLQMNQ